jgi:DNA gyrase subunit B
MSEEIKKDNYSADSIQALEGMEHVECVRRYMYEGGSTSFIYEVVDNSIDEAWVAIVIPLLISMRMVLLQLEDNGRYLCREFMLRSRAPEEMNQNWCWRKV